LIKAHKLHLASDHTAAYWLLHTLRGLAPKTSLWRAAQFDTFPLGLIKSLPAGSTRGSRLGSLSSLRGSRSPCPPPTPPGELRPTRHPRQEAPALSRV
jgi:hypothetical protein